MVGAVSLRGIRELNRSRLVIPELVHSSPLASSSRHSSNLFSTAGVPFTKNSEGVRTLKSIAKPLQIVRVLSAALCSIQAAQAASPQPVGKMVDLGGHQLHLDCTGRGAPTVVIETGLGDFSFDWILVQGPVSQFTRICTYDRAGYAWSDPGPKPRTFAQVNLELHDALQKLGERGPFVLVGHSYGGPVVRNFAAVYPRDVAALVLVDSAVEGMRVGVGGKQTIQLGVNVQPRKIPAPRETLTGPDKPQAPPAGQPQPPNELEPLYKSLPPAQQKLHLWAQSLPGIEDAENSQREWSEQYFALWLADPRRASLGTLPLLVLTRANGGYEDADVPAAQLEQERKEGQSKLAHLSTNSRQILVPSGHNMNLEDPAAVSDAIHQVVKAVRQGQPLGNQ
jgi:pimeloyl-ACP methyl ester carboxylesterase